MNKSKCIIDDGFRADLVEEALFSGVLEIPAIEAPKEIIIPEGIIPFSQIARSRTYDETVAFYEYDLKFSKILTSTGECLEELRKFKGIISPDFSLYRDMPLCLQIANTYMNRAVGHYLQTKGLYVIPNIRWGDERTYTTGVLPEKIAFLGAPKHSIVSIGSYGCIQGKRNQFHFKNGLNAMIDELEPEVVLVYGSMPDSIFGDIKNKTRFIQYQDWISLKKKEAI